VIVTARSSGQPYDFVARFFAPQSGVDEDPVTGSAYCALAPWWRGQLGKDEMTAYQASRRGGIVRMKCAAERVLLLGRAVTTMRGELLC
jgi:predicted PhzF superfamily epimerase YddE/YHI9